MKQKFQTEGQRESPQITESGVSLRSPPTNMVTPIKTNDICSIILSFSLNSLTLPFLEKLATPRLRAVFLTSLYEKSMKYSSLNTPSCLQLIKSNNVLGKYCVQKASESHCEWTTCTLNLSTVSYAIPSTKAGFLWLIFQMQIPI